MRLRPRVALFHNNLGMAYGALGDIDNAEKEFVAALKLNPRLAKAHNNLGKIFYFRGDYEKAAQYFANSKTLEPGILDDMGPLKAMVYFCNAKILMSLDEKQFAAYASAFGSGGIKVDKDNRAINKLQQAIALKPDYVEAYEALVGLYRKTGDTDKALQAQRTLDSLKSRTSQFDGEEFT